MELLGNQIQQKSAFKYYCIFCDYGSNKKCNYNTHISCLKHYKHCKMETNGNQIQPIQPKISQTNQTTCQHCNKQFKHRSGLWKHNKKCANIKQDNEHIYQGINIKDKDALVLHLLQQNGELQNKIIDLSSQTSIHNIHNNSHNTTNNAFNLNFFLNETCKHAMNITDFVSSIQLNLEDLEHTGRTGYIEGVSNIILKNLSKLEQHLRPLHCSDSKREVLYIKDNNEWTKETEDKPILTKAIKTIANKNIKQISKWKDNYPDCIKSDSRKNDLYLKIVSNSMNGLTKEESDKNIHKIITNVAKKVVIEK
jgi:hypothetical protein